MSRIEIEEQIKKIRESRLYGRGDEIQWLNEQLEAETARANEAEARAEAGRARELDVVQWHAEECARALELEDDRDRWRGRAQALERIAERSCATCVHRCDRQTAPCCECHITRDMTHMDKWEFDEKRYAPEVHNETD